MSSVPFDTVWWVCSFVTSPMCLLAIACYTHPYVLCWQCTASLLGIGAACCADRVQVTECVLLLWSVRKATVIWKYMQLISVQSLCKHMSWCWHPLDYLMQTSKHVWHMWCNGWCLSVHRLCRAFRWCCRGRMMSFSAPSLTASRQRTRTCSWMGRL